MSDFLTALGLVLVIEGLVYGLFPDSIRRIGRMVEHIPDATMRRFGIGAAVLGVAVVWLVRR